MSAILRVAVHLDSDLLPLLDCQDKTNRDRVIEISKHKLIYSIGTIEGRRFAPTNRQKYTDKTDLLEKLVDNTNEFRLRISDMQNTLSSEIISEISEEFGVGLSVVIARKLFDIDTVTIQKIKGIKGTRPDWSAILKNNRKIVVESKGSINGGSSDSQENDALVQKRAVQADLNIASISEFYENKISYNRFLDPPSENNELDIEYEKKIHKAGHYSSVFSFLGQSMLSRYFSWMRNKLEKELTFTQQRVKNKLFQKIINTFDRAKYDNNEYVGKYYKIDGNKFLFIGVDINLLTYEGFLNTNDSAKESEKEIQQNTFMLSEDGILIIDIKNIEYFSDYIGIEKISSYQEQNTIIDIDIMSDLTFQKYIAFLLKSSGIEYTLYKKTGGDLFDIYATICGIRIGFDLKLIRRKYIPSEVIYQINNHPSSREVDKVVLITNASFKDEKYELNEKTRILDRQKLRTIIKNPSILLDILLS